MRPSFAPGGTGTDENGFPQVMVLKGGFRAWEKWDNPLSRNDKIAAMLRNLSSC
jgi:hypothetical protein